MVILRVTYKVPVQHIRRYEMIFREEVLPLVRDRRLRFLGAWKTFVGVVGEYLELWEFESLESFEEQWRGLMNDPHLQSIFERTGPMVLEETFSLLEPVHGDSIASPPWDTPA